MEVSSAGYLAGGTVLLAAAALTWLFWRDSGLPPGPWGLPYFGALRDDDQPWHLKSLDISKKYNSDIVSFREGGQLYIVLHGYSLIKEAFQTRGKDFCDRPIAAMPPATAGFNDEFFTGRYNAELRLNRMFGAGALRSACFGIGMSLETKVLSECKILIDFFHRQSGKPILVESLIEPALARIITTVIYGSDYTTDDPEVQETADIVHQVINTSFSDMMVAATRCPSWARSFLFSRTVKECREVYSRMENFMKNKVEEHRATLNKNEPRDVLDVYLIARDGPGLDEQKLLHTMWKFIFDAVNALTAVTTIALYHLAKYEQVQNAIQMELEANLDKDETLRLSHRLKLSYLQATVFECFRYYTPFQLGTEHGPLRDTTLRGYRIPKDSCVFASIYSVLNDPDIFPEPQKFDPGHFLSPDGEIQNLDYLLTFSIGKRSCLGEQNAKSELFLILGCLLRKCAFSLPQRELDADDKKAAPQHDFYYFQKFEEIKVCARPR